MDAFKDVSRRHFLKASAGGAASLFIGFYLTSRSVVALAQETAAPAPAKLPSPNAFLRIGADESVTVLLAHSEMGQGIWTTLPILIAEELECDWSKIRVEHAPAAPAYFHTAFGIQMTGGSTSTWSEFDRYRQAGALAREMLIQAAAAQWKVDPKSCRLQAWVRNSRRRRGICRRISRICRGVVGRFLLRSSRRVLRGGGVGVLRKRDPGSQAQDREGDFDFHSTHNGWRLGES